MKWVYQESQNEVNGMIALEGRLQWRKTAPFHIQIELQKRSMPFRVPSPVDIPGRVVRVFRTDGRLAEGDQVAFVLWVCRPGDEPTGPAYVYHDDFIQATHMEVYLYGSPPNANSRHTSSPFSMAHLSNQP